MTTVVDNMERPQRPQERSTAVSHKKVPPHGKCLSVFLHPIMFLMSGDVGSSPQRTHIWNHRSMDEKEAQEAGLNVGEGVVVSEGMNTDAQQRFIVLENYRDYPWHIAWEGSHTDNLRLSLITFQGPVRAPVVVGHQTKFYGIHAETGFAVPIRKIGEGVIGQDQEWRHIPLL